MAKIIDFKIGPINTTAAVGIPSGSGPFPGVVLTFHRYGIDNFTHWLVDDLVKNGFAAIAPNHFHVIPPDKTSDDRKDYLLLIREAGAIFHQPAPDHSVR